MHAHTHAGRPFGRWVADVSLPHAGNEIGDSGVIELAVALKLNNTIKELNLNGKSGGGGMGGMAMWGWGEGCTRMDGLCLCVCVCGCADGTACAYIYVLVMACLRPGHGA